VQKHAWRFVARPLCCFSIYPNSSADKRHVDVVVAHDHVDAILPMPVYLEIMHMINVHMITSASTLFARASRHC